VIFFVVDRLGAFVKQDVTFREIREKKTLSFLRNCAVCRGMFSAVALATSTEATVFTALHKMQTLSSDENSVRLSVRPSVKRGYCDRTAKNQFRFIYHT